MQASDLSERLSQIENLLERSIAASDQRLTRLEQAMAASNERLTRTEQIVDSNSRSIQALADRISELAHVQEEATDERRELREAMLRLEGVAQGIANLLSSLDQDRPTVLRKVNSIENKF